MDSIDNLFRLDGKVVLITGGAGSIGKSFATAFASAGADLVIADYNEEKTDQLLRELQDNYAIRVLGIQIDVTQEEQVQAMISQAQMTMGSIDVLINNAGISLFKEPELTEGADWDRVIAVNLKSTFLCSKAVYPIMRNQGSGKIINMSSMFSLFGSAIAPAYAASKGAVVQLTKSLAIAWAPDNIRVNAIMPGFIDTELSAQSFGSVPGLIEGIKSRTPMARLGQPDECAGAAIFLAANASNFITGSVLTVDGGFSIM